jgi:hypothetical protein
VLEAKDSVKSTGEMRQQPKELNKGNALFVNLFFLDDLKVCWPVPYSVLRLA